MYKTYQLKIQEPNNKYFDALFREAKWFYNTCLVSDNIFNFNTKIKSVEIGKDEKAKKEFKYLSSQMKQELRKRQINAILGLAALKKNGHKVGRLKFKKFLNSVPFLRKKPLFLKA